VQEAGVSDLLFAQLAGDQQVELVERERLADVVSELDLAAALGPKDAARRLELGKLLKADLLLIARRADQPQPHYQLVAAETGRGLRLLIDSHPVGKDAQADAAALLTAVQRAIKKHREEIREVCAVPPFVSDDLGFEHAHLKAAFAKVIEGALAQRPGLLFVELEEAQAISQEIAVLDASQRLRRQTPLYFLGRFRHFKEKDAPRIRLQLAAKRGEKILAEQELVVEPGKASTELRRLAVELADKLYDTRVTLPAAVVEAETLAERSRVFQTVGNWSEAAALAEASLLLDPQQEQLRQRCVVIYTAMIGVPHSQRDLAGYTLALQSYSRGLHHFEAFLCTAKDLHSYKSPSGASFVPAFLGWSMQLRIDVEGIPEAALREVVAPLWQQVRAQDKAVANRVLRMRAKAGFDDSNDYVFWAMNHVAEADRFDFVFKVCEELATLPDAGARTLMFARMGRTPGFLDNPQGDAYLKRFEASKHEPLRQAAATLRAHIAQDRGNTGPKLRVLPGPREIPPQQPLQFEKVSMTMTQLSGKDLPVSGFLGVAKAGKGIDVVWWNTSIALMKRPGELQEVWNAQGKVSVINFVSFDGKYIWVSVIYPLTKERPHLLVIDPASAKVWPVTHECGLPFQDPSDLRPDQGQLVAVCGYAPGKACVAGTFGRGWVAVVEFDPLAEGKPHAEVILEATMVAEQNQPKQHLEAKLAFSPTYMLAVPGSASEKPGPRVVIGRDTPLNEAHFFPLIVDPTARKAEVTAHRLPNAITREHVPWIFETGKQSVYMVAFNIPDAQTPLNALHLYQLRSPDFRPEPMVLDAPPGRVLFHDGQLDIAGEEWWRMSPDKKRFHQLGVVPWHFSPRIPRPMPSGTRLEVINVMGPDTMQLFVLADTNHYGLVACTNTNTGNSLVHALKFRAHGSPASSGP
jgi:hypothetical protein